MNSLTYTTALRLLELANELHDMGDQKYISEVWNSFKEIFYKMDLEEQDEMLLKNGKKIKKVAISIKRNPTKYIDYIFLDHLEAELLNNGFSLKKSIIENHTLVGDLYKGKLKVGKVLMNRTQSKGKGHSYFLYIKLTGGESMGILLFFNKNKLSDSSKSILKNKLSEIVIRRQK
jgi:hypothetical protein